MVVVSEAEGIGLRGRVEREEMLAVEGGASLQVMLNLG